MAAEFMLSPGITPLLTDLFVLEFPLAAGIAYGLRGGRGFELILALNLFVLGLIKLATDYTDLPDLPVAFAGIVGGAWWLAAVVAPSVRPSAHPGWGAVGGAVIGAIGGIKILRDFYDPFDLLLAVLALVVGLWAMAPFFAPRFGLSSIWSARPADHSTGAGGPSSHESPPTEVSDEGRG